MSSIIEFPSTGESSRSDEDSARLERDGREVRLLRPSTDDVSAELDATDASDLRRRGPCEDHCRGIRCHAASTGTNPWGRVPCMGRSDSPRVEPDSGVRVGEQGPRRLVDDLRQVLSDVDPDPDLVGAERLESFELRGEK